MLQKGVACHNAEARPVVPEGGYAGTTSQAMLASAVSLRRKRRPVLRCA